MRSIGTSMIQGRRLAMALRNVGPSYEYKLRDISGDKTTSFELPFKIAS